jgi:CO dehydrogenase/acetyl-CoA synthase epsilon subunit
MAHSEDLEKIKQKIRGLMSKTVDRGCTHSEAEAAMLMVGKLLEQYNISMDTVDVAEEKCITIVCGAGTLKRSLHSLYSSAIAVLCDVRHWMQKTRVEQTFVYFGFEPDVQMAQYLFKLLDSAIKYD